MSEKKEVKKLVIVKGRKVEITDKKITTGEFRLSYPNLHVPKVNKKRPTEDPKYNCALIFSKDTDIGQLKIAAENACIEKWGPDKAQWPSKKIKVNGVVKIKSLVKKPFKDGDREMPDKEEYENSIFFNASCKKAPGVFDQKKKPLSKDDIKAGDYCRASLIANAYHIEEDGAYGVSFTLMGVQLIREGERLGGGNAANDFDELDYEEPQDLDEQEADDNSEEEDSEF